MGNIGSSSNSNGGNSSRRRHGNHYHNHQNGHSPTPPPQPSQPEMTGNRYVFAAATPYPPQYPNPNPSNYYQYSGYYPPPLPVPLPTPYDHHQRHAAADSSTQVNWVGGGRYPSGPVSAPPPYVDHQKAITIRNDVNLKKETLRVEPDEENPGQFLVAFTFDATVAGSITVIFFAKEGAGCNLSPLKENMQSVTVSFQKGLGQKFRQPSGTGIDFSNFEEAELTKEGDVEAYPLAVKAVAMPHDHNDHNGCEAENQESVNSQITQAIFEKEKGGYQVKVVKQILWVNAMRYELQEIYGIGNSVESDFDGNDPGKECVICLSEPRDTTVLPCRHMCMCSGCAKVLRFQTNRCPICRQPISRLLEIKVNNRPDE